MPHVIEASNLPSNSDLLELLHYCQDDRLVRAVYELVDQLKDKDTEIDNLEDTIKYVVARTKKALSFVDDYQECSADDLPTMDRIVDSIADSLDDIIEDCK